jgi:hypothetical protein
MPNTWWDSRRQAAEAAFENKACGDLTIVLDEMLDATRRNVDPAIVRGAREHLARARRYAKSNDSGRARAAYVKALHHLP